MKRVDIYNKIVHTLETEQYDANPKFIYAQFVHETGNFTSNIFLTGNNVCGMNPSSRKLHNGQFSNAEKTAKYASVDLSILDYVRYCKQSIFGKPPVVPYKTPSKFYKEFTRRGYATDPKYYEKCMKVFKSEFPNFSTVTADTIVEAVQDNKVVKMSKNTAITTIVVVVGAIIYLAYRLFKSMV